MNEAFICDAVRTPIGRYGGALSSIRTDDLASIPIQSLLERNPGRDSFPTKTGSGSKQDHRFELTKGLPRNVQSEFLQRHR